MPRHQIKPAGEQSTKINAKLHKCKKDGSILLKLKKSEAIVYKLSRDLTKWLNYSVKPNGLTKW